MSLVARGVSFRYPRSERAIRMPDVDLATGASGVVVGPSGSGKTTLLDLAAGVRLPSEGSLVAGGFDWASVSEGARRERRLSEVGLVFQEFELFDHLSVEDNVLLPYLIHPRASADAAARERARGLAAELGIAELMTRPPRELSQGERQRVAIARALVTEPSLVLADEPTGNLDPEATTAVIDLFLSAVRGRGATLLLVTHDHSLLPAFDEVIEL